jgi:hypothetical protein
MGRRGHGRSASQDDDGVGCAWGLMRMLYFRRDPKFLLDAKQLSGRRAFREVSGKFSSLTSNRSFYDIFLLIHLSQIISHFGIPRGTTYISVCSKSYSLRPQMFVAMIFMSVKLS